MREKFFFKIGFKVVYGLIIIIYYMFGIRFLFIRFLRGRVILVVK